MRTVSFVVFLILGLLATGSASVSAGRRNAGDAPPLKAVIVVGPTHGATSNYLNKGRVIADIAESFGMDVRRVFHPNATWSRVVEQAQGANLLVYLGHGNGWPSPYAPFQEDTKNGMGLNPYVGGSQTNVKYYGANKIRDRIDLAPNAVVMLNNLCYAEGNGEPGMAIPSWSTARQRVDNFAAGFLAVGARAVFAYGWQPVGDVVKLLFTTEKSIDEIFMTRGSKPEPYLGFVGWDNRRFDSERTDGARNHLDPDSQDGFLRAVTGDLSMTAAQWRGGSLETDVTAPTVTELATINESTTVRVNSSAPSVFTPNGDGISDSISFRQRVDENANLDIEIRNEAGTTVRSFTVWSDKGTRTVTWNGRNDKGSIVADGRYDILVRGRDKAGNVREEPATVRVRVLTSLKSPQVTPNFFHAGDDDALAPSGVQKVTVMQPATISWRIVDQGWNTVRTQLTDKPVSAGPLSWTWNARDNDGDVVKQGTYFSVVTATTDAGTFSHRTAMRVGAFKLTSKVLSAGPGEVVQFSVYTAEPLSGAPRLLVTQPGLDLFTVSTSKVRSDKYLARVTFLPGAAGQVDIRVEGTDTNGGDNASVFTFRLTD